MQLTIQQRKQRYRNRRRSERESLFHTAAQLLAWKWDFSLLFAYAEAFVFDRLDSCTGLLRDRDVQDELQRRRGGGDDVSAIWPHEDGALRAERLRVSVATESVMSHHLT